MAELIDKDEALKLFDNCAFQTMNYVTVKGRLNTLSTVTEAEIRARTIDEFSKKAKGLFSERNVTVFEWNKLVDDIAEQLKEE